MTVRTVGYTCASFALALLAAAPSVRLLAQEGHHHAPKQAEQLDQKDRGGALVKLVRASTERFKNVAAAERENYHLMFGCVSGPDYGAMGLHYVNLDLVGDGELDPARPEIVIYEPVPNGPPRLIGADYLVFAEQWHAKNEATPQIMGQLMHLIESPNRYGLPSFYTLHVWAWKESATGPFVNWHPNVSCDAFGSQGR